MEVEVGNPGGDDDVESIGSGGPVEAEASPPAARRPRHVAELADLNTPTREHNKARGGRTRAQTRAVNQQSIPGLAATLGPISASEIVYAFVAEQRAGDEIKNWFRMLSQSLVAIKKPSNQSTPIFGR